MKAAYKVLLLVGSIFAFVGVCILVPFIANINVFKGMVAIPAFFVLLGIGFMIPAFVQSRNNKIIVANGKRRTATICDYVEDTSATVNGAYPVNTLVRYFDDYGRECETVLETGFLRGSNAYPLGMTLDIYEYNGKISWDKASVRSEEIPAEAEVTAMECRSCGASFCATKGFVSKCPYCGRVINEE